MQKQKLHNNFFELKYCICVLFLLKLTLGHGARKFKSISAGAALAAAPLVTMVKFDERRMVENSIELFYIVCLVFTVLCNPSDIFLFLNLVPFPSNTSQTWASWWRNGRIEFISLSFGNYSIDNAKIL
jgi:hypothetical protein